jgi:hypothetical protein
VDFEEEE